MKKFTISCQFGASTGNFTVYIGKPEGEHHPLHFQADWLSKERGGAIPQKVMDSLQRLKEIADKNNVSFEELCEYALQAAKIEDKTEQKDSKPVVSDKPNPPAQPK
jgi:hypothetical protein